MNAADGGGAQAGAGASPAAGAALVLLDGNALFHRSFHAFPEEMRTTAGEPTNAVFGFARMLLDVLRFINPAYLVVTFDRPTPTFRHKSYTPYKAHRPPVPDAMRPQFARVRELVAAFRMPVYEWDGFEADDVLGTLACQATAARTPTIIATGDLDTLQLVNDLVRVTFARSPRRGEFEYFDVAAVEARYGFAPPRLVDYKGLVGDPSDNIPGVPGIGQKTATKLIQEYGTLEEILTRTEALPPRVRAALTEHEAQARQSKYLATIVTDVPLTLDLMRARALRYDLDEVRRFFFEMEFYSQADRIPQPASDIAPSGGARAPAVVTPPNEAASGEVTVAGGEDTSQLNLFAASDLQALAEEGGTQPFGIATPLAPRPPTLPTSTNTLVIDTPEALDVLAHSLATAPVFSFDLETDSVNEMRAEIVGLAFAMGAGEAYYIPTGHTRDAEGNEPGRQLPLALVLERLRAALTDPALAKVAHNAKFDMMVLARHGVWVEGVRCDTMVGAYLLNPGRRGLGLKEQAFENLGIDMTPITKLLGRGSKQLTMAQVPIAPAAQYAGADADITLRLMERIESQLQAQGLLALFRDIEMPLMPVLARMELAGIRIDPEFLRRMGRELDEQLAALVGEIYAAVGHEFNINSNRQLGDVLFGELKLPHGRKTKTGYSVDAKVLDGLRGLHPAVDTLLEYRQLSKLRSTYVEGLLELMDPVDHRVHTSFNQTIASTGRLSSSDPNLQNIPVRTEVGKRIRRAFLADPGTFLLAADYSQIELRILAHITGEPALVAAFEADEDIHAATAAQLFKVSLAEVTNDQRRLAKTVNFAVLYGQSAFGLSRVTGMSNSEASEFIRTYEQTFPKVRAYVQGTLRQVRADGYVQTLLGRKRYLPDLAALPVAQRQAAEREAVNMPIQGTNADMIKLAMIHLSARLRERELTARLILQVHDELVLEVPDEEVEIVSGLVCDAMEGAMPLNVPVKVEMKLGRNWYDVQPLERG
ncbi:MAG: DNA polymerase I [Ktedonobacterales bacterium]|nr:DNA polymerase I [Ktedonobacterales bacterium]